MNPAQIIARHQPSCKPERHNSKVAPHRSVISLISSNGELIEEKVHSHEKWAKGHESQSATLAWPLTKDAPALFRC